MRSILFCLLVTVLLVPMANAAAGDTTPRILVLGDSISAGYGMDTDEAWPQLLQQRLESQGQPHTVINASVSGDTTSSGRSRLPNALERHQPAIVIIQLGGNDGLRGLSLEAMHNNLEAMVQIARDTDAQVLLLGIRLPENYGRAYIEQFVAVFSSVAEQMGVPLVQKVMADVAENPDLMLSDGIHPNPAGQEGILENIWPSLQELL